MDNVVKYITHCDPDAVVQLLPSYRNQAATLRQSPCYVQRLHAGVGILVQGPLDEDGRRALDRLILAAEKKEAISIPYTATVEERNPRKAIEEAPPRPINRTRNR